MDSIPNKNLDFVKTKIKDAALNSVPNYNANLPRNLLGEKFEALQNLSKNTNLLIQKSDIGNSVVILDKDVHIKNIKLLLSDKAKFEKIDTKKGLLNFRVNQDLVFYVVFVK